MGFNAVYRCLMEMFPQIDTRLLKAVAIEHSKDADAAAIIVLTEILPYWSKKSLTSSSIILVRDLSPRGLSDEIAEREELNTQRPRRNRTQCSSLEQGSITSVYATGTDLTCAHNSDTISLDKAMNVSAVSQSYDPNDSSAQFFGNSESEEVILLGKPHESIVEVGANKVSTAMPNVRGYSDFSQACANTESKGLVSLDKGRYTDVKVEPEQPPIVMSTLSIHANGVANGNLTTWNDFDGHGATDVDISNCGVSQEVGSCLDCPLMVDSSVAQLVPSSVQEHTSDVPESGFQLEIGSTSTTDSGKPDTFGSSDLTSKQENSMTEKSDIEDDSTIDTVVTGSGQICRIDLLEEMIEDAKNNKKNLSMAMESVMNIMREVENQEKAAKEAKAAVEKEGFDIFVKMEELKQMLAHAKETNDMHAGEIYGEKAILATEARELQSRLLSLSEERDKSLAILDEMCETLEARQAAAEEMRKAAEEEHFEREESARASLAEQEATMEVVVQESKLLQQQAEENSKLREFLMDRGRVVDSLQGEISVICQDVRLLKEKFDERVRLSKSVCSSQTTAILSSSGSSLKSMASLVSKQGLTSEKFDERVPLSKSVSSSQTTCILASSGSSLKSMASLVAERGLTSETTSEKVSLTPSVDAQSPKSSLDDKKTGDVWRQLADDGWHLFENEIELNGNVLPE